MSRYTFGVLLRLLGPLLEFGAVIAYFQYGRRGVTLGGVPVEFYCFAAFGIGLVMVFAGLSLSALRPRRRGGVHPSRFELDLGASSEGRARAEVDRDR